MRRGLRGDSPTRRVREMLRRSLRLTGVGPASGPLVLAVSGGADSMAMLLAAASLGTGMRGAFVAAHFSHGIRPTVERREAALVRRTAAGLGIDVRFGQARVTPTEAGAREARYAFLAGVAKELGAAAVLTAHTRNDQAETLLLRLTRGAGSLGAGSIRELSRRRIDGYELTLLRPLLEADRDETVAVCAEADIRPASDGTNRSLRYARNRVRKRVLPELTQINPGVLTSLTRFAANVGADDDFLQALAVEAVAGAESRTDEAVTWPRALLLALAPPLSARVLQQAWAHVGGEGSMLSSAKVVGAQHLIAGGGGGSLDLGRGGMLIVEQDECTMRARAASARASRPVSLPVPGSAMLGGWRIAATLMEGRRALPTGRWLAAVDFDTLGHELCLRTRRRGERFQPLGMTGAVRLQDAMVDARIPRTQRPTLPLVASDEGLVWVPGVRIAHRVRVTDGTEQVLLLEAQRM